MSRGFSGEGGVLSDLGRAARVGYDVAEGALFHRELPFDSATIDGMHPRLRAAHALVEAGVVSIGGDVAQVRSGGTEYVVRRTPGGDSCSCPWYGKHKASRGPCKHVLAVNLVR